MKRFIFSAAVLFTALSFTGCDKDKEKPVPTPDGFIINAQVKNGANFNALVDEVRAMSYGDEDVFVLAKAPYQNGGFKITLPGKVDEKLLFPMDDDAPEGITISDRNVKICTAESFEAYKNGEHFDDLIQVAINLSTFSMVQRMYMYADRNVTITGVAQEEEMTMTYDIDFKKGWNAAYISISFMTGTMTFTTTPPATLPEWWFAEDFYNSMPFAPQKSPKMLKKLF